MDVHSSAAELKVEGVLDAAKDPNNSVTAADAEQRIVAESQKAGVAAFTFDPDATPEQKAAQARAVSNADPHLMVYTDCPSAYRKASTTNSSRRESQFQQT